MPFDPSELKAIRGALVKSEFHRAFVLCWLALKNSLPFFQESEKRYLDSPHDHQQKCQRVLEAIISKEALLVNNLPVDNPFALLEAIDTYLYLRYGRQGPSPPICIEVKLEKFYIYRRVSNRHRLCRYSKQTGHLSSKLKYHWIVPSQINKISIWIKPSSRAHLPISSFDHKDNLKIFFGNFPDGVNPAWLSRPNSSTVTAVALTNPEKRRESILHFLETAVEAGAQILVMPELTICPELRQWIAKWLYDHEHPFLMVLAGSFYQKIGDKIFNHAELLSRSGNTMLFHDKLIRSGESSNAEDITAGSRIDLLSTPFGLVAIPICRDFCENDVPFSSLWKELGVDLHLVPAFGKGTSLHAHERRAKDLLLSHGAISSVAQQHPDGVQADAGFVCHNLEKGTPTLEAGNCVQVRFYLENELK
jgi:hypothetical protein